MHVGSGCRGCCCYAFLSGVQGGLVSDALPNQDVTAMKQRLANAVQKTFVGSAESSKHSQSSEVRDTLLDDLLALPPPQHSR